MTYSWQIYNKNTKIYYKSKGKRFDCKHVPILKKFNLTDSSKISANFIVSQNSKN